MDVRMLGEGGFLMLNNLPAGRVRGIFIPFREFFWERLDAGVV